MKPALQVKTKIVNELVNNFKTSTASVVMEYHKLTVAELTELRLLLSGENIVLKVYKNNLVSIAAKEAGYSQLDEFLTGPNAFAFAYGEALVAAKIIAKFAKKHKALKLKAGIYEGKVLDTQAINEIALLPTKPELIAMFAASLLYPLRMFAISVKEIAKTRSEN